ncbi:unnamed protein product, partial [Timema podura]|nr:unnamed protein product [Timema podura]
SSTVELNTTSALANYATEAGDPSFLNNTSNQSEINEPLSDNFWNFPEAVGSHVAAVDLDDLYVSVVSGLNTWYGSQLLTDGGFILNNALKNFGTGSNSPAPGKRPFTLAVPMIAVQHDQICGRRIVLGAGDATVAIQLLTRLLAFGDNATLGVEAPRFRVASGGTFLQLEGWHEPLFGKATLDTFTGSGFKLHLHSEPYQSVNVVEKYGDTLTSHSDSRGGGLSSRF